MSIKSEYETYRYTDEICRLRAQSIVECRLPGSEIGGVLAVQATAMPTECVCADGEARYGGKLILSLIYEDGAGKICRAERGAEFFHKAEGKEITPACFGKPAFECENVTWRREGSGLYIAVVVSADIAVYGGKQMEYLLGGEDLVVKTEKTSVSKCVCVSGETEGEDEFDADRVGDILMHNETALVTRVNASAGQLTVEGELQVGICVLSDDESVCAYERLIPFSVQIPCEEAFGEVRAHARVRVKDVRLTASLDEEKGKGRVLLSYVLSADCFLYAKEELEVVKDAFSTVSKIETERVNGGGKYLTNVFKCTERVSGVASLSPSETGEYTLAAAVLPKAEIVCKKGERGAEAEGVVSARVLLKGAEGGYKACSLSLPFLFPLDTDGEILEAECLVCGLNVRRKRDGETEAEATLRLCVRVYEEKGWEYIAEVNEIEPLPENGAAVSVFIPRAGEDLWTVAKRLSRDPDELKKSNPKLEFPVKEGERIVVYRQIK